MTMPVNIDTTYADDGSDASVALHQQHHDRIHEFVNAAGMVGDLPTGYIAETIPRQMCNNASAVGTSGQLKVSLIWLRQGQVVSNLTFVAANTGGASLTHSMAGLYSASQTAPALLAGSADDTTATWTANTSRTYAMTTPYTVTATGYFYVASFLTGTTLPAFYIQNPSQGTGLAALAPISGGICNSSLTTSLPNPASAPTVNASRFYALVS